MNDQLQESLDSLKASLAETEKLRNTVKTVCSWTKQIKDEGKWISLEEFMKKHYGLQFTHGISEEIAKELIRQERERQGKQLVAPAPVIGLRGWPRSLWRR